MDVAQTLSSNLQKGHEAAMDHRGEGRGVGVKLAGCLGGEVKKKKYILKGKDAFTPNPLLKPKRSMSRLFWVCVIDG